MKTLKIATRQSPLALWQAEHIKQRLEQMYADVHVELVTFVTQGDKILDTPLAKIGGKGLFVKELEAALLDGRADLASRVASFIVSAKAEAPWVVLHSWKIWSRRRVANQISLTTKS